MTISGFCNRYGACCEGREWALANCSTMQDVWNTARPDWVIWVATRPGVLSDRELRLYTHHCIRYMRRTLQQHNVELSTIWQAVHAIQFARREAVMFAREWAIRAIVSVLAARVAWGNAAQLRLGEWLRLEIEASEARYLRQYCHPNFGD